MPKANSDHVVMKDNAFCCLRCGDRYTMNMPVDLGVMIAASKAYVARHRRCDPSRAAAGAGIKISSFTEEPDK